MRSRLRPADLWLVDSLVVPASLHDVQGRFVHLNAAAERASGLVASELLGRHVTDLVSPEMRAKVAAHFRNAIERGEPTDFETRFVDATGCLRGVRAQHLPLRSGDEIVGVLILAFDVLELPAEPFPAEPRLTARQREILDLIASGLSTSEIATKLIISTETVRNHVRGVLRELHAHTRLEGIAAARRIGLLSRPVLKPQPDPPARSS